MRSAVIVNQTRGATVCELAELADTPFRRLVGLLGRRELPAGRGMLITPAPSIHSAFMRFHFDAVFLDRDMRIIRIAEQIPPWKVRAAKGSKSVLELAAGQSAERGLQVGDVLAVTATEGPLPAAKD